MSWFNKWGIKINESKSAHVTFSLRPLDCSPITLNNSFIPHCFQVKYLGLTLDRKLTRDPHFKEKRKKLNSRLHLLRPLLRSKINIPNKPLIYKSPLPYLDLRHHPMVLSQKIKYSNNPSVPVYLYAHPCKSPLVCHEQYTPRWTSNKNHSRHSYYFLQKISQEILH